MSFNEILGIVMLVGMISVIFVGFPISFTLLFLAFVFGSIGIGPDQTFNLAYLQIWGTMKDDILPAVPLFIFMGYMTEQAGLMERLFRALRHLLAPVRGSLYLAVILTATIFAMATGIVGAAVTVLGIMAGPIMIKTGYDAKLSAGAIAAGGTLGILIPPSVMLVVMGPTMGVPVNMLYSAAFGPGFMLAGLYIAYTLARSFWNPALGPPVPKEERVGDAWLVIKEVLIGVVPLAALIGFTLGTILGGLATPTEAASCGAFGATLLALLYRPAHAEGAVERGRVDHGDLQHGAAARRVLERVRCRLHQARHCQRHHQHSGQYAASRHLEAGADHVPDLHPGLAVRVAGDRAGVPADLPAGGGEAAARHVQARHADLVRHAGGGQPADRLPQSARRHVGLLPQERRAAVEPVDDLQGHGRLHGDPDPVPARLAHMAADRALAAAGAQIAPAWTARARLRGATARARHALRLLLPT